MRLDWATIISEGAAIVDLFQIETEAVDPGTLQQLVTDAVTDSDVFDRDEYDRLIEREDREQQRLWTLIDDWDDDDGDDPA